MPISAIRGRIERSGLGLRIFLAFVFVVVLTLGVGAAVFASLFGGYRETIDRNELLSVANTITVDFLRGVQQAQPPEEIGEIIRTHAEDSHTLVLLLNAQGQVLSGFEPSPGFRNRRVPITWKQIEAGRDSDGWLQMRMVLNGGQRPALARVLAIFTNARQQKDAILLAVAFSDDHPDAVLANLAPRLLISGLAGLAAAALLALILSRSLVRPLRDLTGVVAEFGRGRQDVRAAEFGPLQIRELAAAFNSMARRVGENERAMRGFIADVSHELRTPLTSIRGFTQAMLDGTIVSDEHRRRSLEVVEQETRRMLRMVEQMLDLSRLEAGERPLELSEVSPAELLEHVEDLFAPRAADRGLELRRLASPDAPTIRADHDRLVQVLSNLVDNALRHTERGWIELRARPAAGHDSSLPRKDPPSNAGESIAGSVIEGGGLILEVEDSGSGIPAERVPHLFDRFYQSPDRSGPGAGLGLAISQEIVRAHQGRISAQSTVGAGTTIQIHLPRAAGP